MSDLKKLADTPPPAPTLHPNMSELYRRKVEDLHEALEDPDIRDNALSILRELDEDVVLHHTEDGFEVELVGEIASMVELVQSISQSILKGQHSNK